MNWICVIVLAFLVIDALVSVAAVARQTERRNGAAADNLIEEWLDEAFDDERLRRTYSNMRFIQGSQ